MGITTSHGRRRRELEGIVQSRSIDFVPLTYHIGNQAVEKRLLPRAHEKGIAVIANRPFNKGELFDKFQHYPTGLGQRV